MHDLVNKLKFKLLQSRKDRDEVAKNILQTAIGEIENAASRQKKGLLEKDCHSIIRKLVASNGETIECIENINKEDARIEKLKAESEILMQFLPKLSSKQDIFNFFDKTDGHTLIKNAESEGKAMGIAMSALKSASMAVDGNDVKEIINSIRSAGNVQK